ncbi:MAG TPA: zf-HC2 domain-containing protein [Bryobacteraceae bacterium]|nr:zf-HC2 domain-containing protein [Bryobacteraceae bacterium]
MNCRSVQISLSAHVDGALSVEDRRLVMNHVETCRDCELRLREMARIRTALRALPQKQAPESLNTSLRVIASRERQRVLLRQRWFDATLTRFHLWVENLMRPLALPFAGGLVSAMVLFSMLLPTFTLHRGAGSDIPVALFTEPSIKAQMAFEDAEYDGDCVVDVLVDDQGRMVDYTVPKGSTLNTNPELRRAIEKKLLFTEFRPATMFGQPTYGRVLVSFQRRSIEIKS